MMDDVNRLLNELYVGQNFFSEGKYLHNFCLNLNRIKTVQLLHNFTPSKYKPIKVLLGYIYPTSNAKSLACDTANEHALTCTRETCSCSQTAVQWNQWR